MDENAYDDVEISDLASSLKDTFENEEFGYQAVVEVVWRTAVPTVSPSTSPFV